MRFIDFILSRKSKSKPPLTVAIQPTAATDLAGAWQYAVVDSGMTYRHSGTCSVVQAGMALQFNGMRLKMIRNRTEEDVRAHWDTSWSQICVDGKVRGEYSILAEPFTKGYFVLSELSPGKMVGKYYTLAPNNLFGTIEFTKVIS